MQRAVVDMGQTSEMAPPIHKTSLIIAQLRTHIDFNISQPRSTETNNINTILPDFFEAS